jgi:MoxR-like ATPase
MSASDSQSLWLLNRPGTEEELKRFLDEQLWESPKPAQHHARLASMAPGEVVVLKGTANRSRDIAFFNADRRVSVMRLYARGTVRSVDADDGRLHVAWESDFEPRDWYFWTLIEGLVKIEATEDDSFRTAFLDFALHNVPQDIGFFLRDPYWGQRYPAPTSFSWTDFYRAFATRLLDFRDDREPLVRAFHEVAKSEPMLRYLTTDQFEDGSAGPIRDLDPFTFMGSFSRNITIENRRRLAVTLAEALDLDVPPPGDFDGIPLLNNQNSWFVRYQKHRQPDDVDKLWTVLAVAVALADEDTPARRREFATAYDDALTVAGVHWNLSLGLYWARPESYATLEGQSRPYIQRRFGLGPPKNGAEYLDVLDALRSRFASATTSIRSFQQLSYAAWFDGFDQAQSHNIAGFAYWAARMAEVEDLETEEHDYKRQMAALMSQARRQAEAGELEWPATFKQALRQSYNLMHYIFRSNLERAVESTPDHWADVFRALWASPGAEGLDSFRDSLAARLDKATPGNATSLGALLLLGVDAENNAPYLTTRTSRWYRLSGLPGPSDNSSPTSRYATMLTFLDQLRSEITKQTGMPVSRLEAQGMAWAVSEYGVPEAWDEATAESFRRFRGDADRSTRVWRISADGATSSVAWLQEGFVSLEVPAGAGGADGQALETITKALRSAHPSMTEDEIEVRAAETYQFKTLATPGDLVCMLQGGRLHVAQLTHDDVTSVPGTTTEELRRPVDWVNDRATESEALADVLVQFDVPGRFHELRVTPGELQDLQTADVEEDSEEPRVTVPSPPATPSRVVFPSADEALRRETNLEPAELQELLDLLLARRQVVFYGPPGTGKTYLALELARHIVGRDNPNRVQLVQFHPSYAYEDFFEGYRPTENGGFRLEKGPLRQLAAAAEKNPSSPFVLVIDEMNRANVAKVFGELYFLLEYRKQSMQLQYSPHEQPFRLPANLIIIGTMNTADRSVALLDAAMRRRFAFVELHPDEAPIAWVLKRFLERQKRNDGRDRLLKRLNERIEEQDRDFKIGPSYLMREEAGTDVGLGRIWRYDILPLLEEHYYGRLTRAQVHEQFGLESLKKSSDVGGPATNRSEVPDSEGPSDGHVTE